jgi:cyclic-di-AMP phosphodiesterase PgpH
VSYMPNFKINNLSKFKDWILAGAFFIFSGVIFYMYSVDFSNLILAFVLGLYLVSLKNRGKLPSYTDVALLAAAAELFPLITIVGLGRSGYWVPAIGFVLLITLLFDNLELSLLYALFISFLSASIEGGNFALGISLFCGSFIAALLSVRARRRSRIINAGIIASLVQFGVAGLVETNQGVGGLLRFDTPLIVMCILNGLISSAVVLGTLHIFEYVFRVVTSISLLELSDFNHPLLKKLIIDAPGTYQHSLVVANMSEAAAESIRANPLLARVGAYYHDIGKMLKPHYFVENQTRYEDFHKDLKPSMSKLIIINHVKDGVELAQKHNLNPRIIDFISQHHGRSLVYYFYQLAKEQEPEGQHEEEYRYPGPRPQTPETAIVCMADMIEALSRTLEEPTPARIEEMVREVIRKKFMDGELDESGLTLKDLEKITQSFIRHLNAIFHTRINYPKDESDKDNGR